MEVCNVKRFAWGVWRVGAVRVALAAAAAAGALAMAAPARAQAPAPAQAKDAARPAPAASGPRPVRPAATPTTPPRVNLLVEWRWSTDPGAPALTGATGARTVSTTTLASGSPAPAAEGSTTVRTEPAARAPHAGAPPRQLVVANGASARTRLSETVALQWVEAWQEPAGKGAVLRQGWTEAVQALEVKVGWPGGQAPVEVDVLVEQADGAGAQGSARAPQRESLGTRVLAPLGEWTTVAAWGEAARPAAAGTVSTTALGASTARVLQLRVSPR